MASAEASRGVACAGCPLFMYGDAQYGMRVPFLWVGFVLEGGVFA